MFKSCTRFENEPLGRGVKESKKFQHNKKKTKNFKNIVSKTPFFKDFTSTKRIQDEIKEIKKFK